MKSIRNPIVRELIRNPKRNTGAHSVKDRELARLREIRREIEESIKHKPRYY